MTINHPGADAWAAQRRLSLLLGLGGALALAGCGSAPPRPTAGRAPAVPATRPPLDLDPAGREASVAQAMLLVNTPYRYGGNTPQGGFDCSGLVHYVFSQVAEGAARRLPRSTAQWAAATVPVQEAALQRGDLVFFNTTGATFSHMGIYVGGGQFVHAPSTGGTVRKEAVAGRYFGPRYQGGRRVFAA
ncbi:MAG: C40 family peptidase [Ottowia sp.]|uniref:C40 family peptidase n=1 Tax=Ottowia sp. TaxID=1898956 RepID=UPI0039E69D8C